MVRVAAIEELIQFDSTYSARIENTLSSFLYDKNENIIKTAEKIIQKKENKKYKFWDITRTFLHVPTNQDQSDFLLEYNS